LDSLFIIAVSSWVAFAIVLIWAVVYFNIHRTALTSFQDQINDNNGRLPHTLSHKNISEKGMSLDMVMDPGKLPVNIQTIPHIYPRVQIFYPRVIGMNNDAAQEKMNQAIIQEVQQLIAEQRKVQVQGETEMSGYYEVKTNERSVLSLIQTNYAYTPQMAHGMTFAKSLTFDVTTGKNYSLSELFQPGSPYEKRISDHIRLQIEARSLPLLDGFQGIKPEQDYYIADKALVVYFQLYEITPYYVGFPMFPISVYELQDIVVENSPLGRMLADV
jgi:hypothetical protein